MSSRRGRQRPKKSSRKRGKPASLQWWYIVLAIMIFAAGAKEFRSNIPTSIVMLAAACYMLYRTYARVKQAYVKQGNCDSVPACTQNASEPPIPEADKKYYQPDSYYTDIIASGTMFERKVIPFAERKKISYPSATGLYVAEILLLQYCSYGNYPHPETGYPGFWWFDYGIRNVEAALQSLAERGYIEFGSAADQLPALTVAQLKDLASKYEIPAKGKKADLVAAIRNGIPPEALESEIPDQKYKLTAKGQAELEANEYVTYMHSAPDKTVEDDTYGEPFNVWTINKALAEQNRTDWKNVIWEEYTRLSYKYMSEGKWGLYRNVRYSMFYFSMYEGRYTDALRFCSEVFFYDMNLDLPTIAPGVVRYAQRCYKKAGLSIDEASDLVSGAVAGLYSPERYVPYNDATHIIVALLSGDVGTAVAMLEQDYPDVNLQSLSKF